MLDDERRKVAEYGRRLAGLTPGRTGNLSVRKGDRIAVTPTGVEYGEIKTGDVPVVSLEGELLNNGLDPTSELPMHLGIYREFDADAVVHTHSTWSTLMGVMREPLPPVHYMAAFAGTGDVVVPVAEYATYGTPELGENCVSAMRRVDSEACFLANHGLIATGSSLRNAFETAESVEFSAEVYCRATDLGEPEMLSETEMENVRKKFEGYGQD
ncbi:MAG: class II aldolase/adducin family protein [Halobacteria archaeon]